MTVPEDHGSGRAKQGETVLVILNHVKADKLEVHRHFVYDVLMAAVQKVAPQIWKSVRFLDSTEPNDDGTHTTVWIMDPFLSEMDYGYESLLTRAYGAEQAAEHMKLVDDYELSGQTSYMLQQSRW